MAGSNGKLLARILENSAGGLAGLAAGLLCERDPTVKQRYGTDGFADWKNQLRLWLEELAAASDAGESSLFEARVQWARRASVARGIEPHDVEAGLTALRDTLRDRLPAGALEAAVEAVDRALATLQKADEPAGEGLESTTPEQRLALTYLKTILEGEPRGAVERILTAVDDGLAIKDAYLKVLVPAQREVGRLWHAGELSIAEEHLVTATTQRLMTLLGERSRPDSRKEHKAVLACVAGNAHDLGLRVIADLFDMIGWQTILLGPDVPDREIARSVRFFEAHVVVLSVTLSTQLRAARRTIEQIRALEDRNVKILVGGPAFDGAPELWRELGADGYSPTLEEAEPLASRLLEAASD